MVSRFLFLLCCLSAWAAPVTLVWDKTPRATEYRLYMGGESLLYTNVLIVQTNVVCLEVEAPTYFALTAANAYGESDKTYELVWNPRTIAVQISSDLLTWQTITNYYDNASTNTVFRYYRLEIR